MKKIVFILSLGLLFAACSEDDAAPIIDPATSDFYPLATFELVNPSSQGAAFVEADTDTILVNVTINEPIVYDSFFTAYPDSTNTATLGVDYEIIDMTIPAYQTTGQLQIVVFDDAFPEMDETVNLTVQPLEGSDGEQYDLLFDPATEYLQLSFTIEDNPTSTTALTAALKWNEDQAEDIDMILFDDQGNILSTAGATANNPEVAEYLPVASAPDGTYYINIIPFTVAEPAFDFTFGFSEPNDEYTTFGGTFDTEDTDQYQTNQVDFGGGNVFTSYRLVEIVKTGSDYAMTQLP
jgi:hypothetical protein